MLIGFSTGASAVTTGTVCPDCYKCVKYSGASCLQCEYDPDYCMGEGLEPVCGDGKVWDADALECVCDPAKICFGTVDPDTCECIEEELACEDGQYHNGMVGLLAQCLDCPTLYGCLRGPHSTGDGAAGITDCYYGVDAICTDSAGSYVFSEDCRYDDSGSSEAEVEEEIEIN